MKILYIDKTTSIENIRIEAQVIFNKELPKLEHEVVFLLSKSDQNKQEKNVFTYKSNILSRFFINITLIKSLKRIRKIHVFDIIVVRNSTALGFIPLLYAKKKRNFICLS